MDKRYCYLYTRESIQVHAKRQTDWATEQQRVGDHSVAHDRSMSERRSSVRRWRKDCKIFIRNIVTAIYWLLGCEMMQNTLSRRDRGKSALSSGAARTGATVNINSTQLQRICNYSQHSTSNRTAPFALVQSSKCSCMLPTAPHSATSAGRRLITYGCFSRFGMAGECRMHH
jgi:hypothetical protein